MQNVGQALELAGMMAAIGAQAGKPTSVLVTDMNQPLGRSVGNALEVAEAMAVLRNESEGDLKQVALTLAAEMLVVSGLVGNRREAESKLDRALGSGEGLRRLQKMIELLGGDPRVCSDTSLLPRAAEEVTVRAESSGRVHRIHTTGIGCAAQLLGAGRAAKEDVIDPAVGLKMRVRLGDNIQKGEEIGRLYVNRRDNLEQAAEHLRSSVAIGDQPVEKVVLIHERIRSGGEQICAV